MPRWRGSGERPHRKSPAAREPAAGDGGLIFERGRTRSLRVLTRVVVAASAAAAAVAAITGCSGGQGAVSQAPQIKVASAYVIASQGPGIADCYLVIQNSGPADQLLAATSSTGGTVTIASAVTTGAGGTAVVVSDGVLIPGHSVVRFDPDGNRLVISHPVRIKDGTDITLTLRFAHAGKVTVAAQVANPQSGIYSYFGP